MVKTKLMILILLCLGICAQAQEYEWSYTVMDGRHTGAKAITRNNVDEAVGTFRGRLYIAPSGKVFRRGSSTAKVAALVKEAQPKMKKVKEVVAFSEEEMPTARRQESSLSNWFVGIVMDKASELSGKKVDVGICNFGGIRVDMPQGDIILDDLLSMFPFKNNVVYLERSGKDLREIFEKMAASQFQALGGVEIVAENGKLTRALIGGEPIDDEKMYGVATISFLLYGGDSLTMAENAVNMEIYDVMIIDAVLDYIGALKAEGKNITAPDVTHVTIR